MLYLKECGTCKSCDIFMNIKITNLQHVSSMSWLWADLGMQQKRPSRKFNNTVPSLQKLLLGVTNNHFICVSDIEFRDNTQNINDNVMMKIPLVFKLQRDQMIVRDSDGHSRSRCIVADSLELHGCFKVNFFLSSCGLLLQRHSVYEEYYNFPKEILTDQL